MRDFIRENIDMNWSLIAVRISLTVIILLFGYFLLKRIWTKEVDIKAFFEKPSKNIPIKESVFVKPSLLDLSTNAWGKIQFFEIKNPDNKNTVFSIWVKIWSEEHNFNFSELELLSENDEKFISVNAGGVNVNFEMLKINAYDANDKPCIYLIVYRMEPNTSKLLKISKRKSKSEKLSPLQVKLKVMNYSDKPAEIATQQNKTALQITPPESMKVRAMSLLLRKENEK